jgi:hypothetical protein
MSTPESDTPGLLHDWQRHMTDLVATLAAVGQAELPRQLVEPMQRQLDLVKGLAERERRLQQQVAEQVVAPVDAVFDLLQESAATLRLQAESLQAAGRALDEAAGLMRMQAQHFERTVEAARRPVDLARAAAGISRPRRTA